MKIHKSTMKKFVVVGASALLALSIGNGTVNVLGNNSTNAHAETNEQAFENMMNGDGYDNDPQDDQDEKNDEKYEYYQVLQNAEQHPEDARGNEEALQSNTYYKAHKRSFVAHVNSAKNKKEPTNNTSKYVHHNKNSNVIKPNPKKKIPKILHKNHKRTKHVNLSKQVANLRNAIRRMNRRINSIARRKYRTKRSKRNAKRYLNRLLKTCNQYKKELNNLSHKVSKNNRHRKNTKRSNKRHVRTNKHLTKHSKK